MPNDTAPAWPDPARPGVPMNPDAADAHLVLWFGEEEIWLWKPRHAGWINSFGGFYSALEVGMALGSAYLGPCLTPQEVQAHTTAAWLAAREACVEYIDGSGASFSLADLRALPPPADAMAALDEVVRVAVEKEREACAKIAEWAHMVPPDGGSPTEDERAVAEAAAAAIRARSEGDD